MTQTRRLMVTSRAAIWEVLADASSYATWLADLVEVREPAPTWPAPGAAFRLRYRWGPFTLVGSATVEASHAPSHLRMRIKRRPFSMATLEFRLRPTDTGTEVELRESRTILLAPAPFNLLDAGYAEARNRVSLGRLEGATTSRVRDSAEARSRTTAEDLS